MSTGTDVSVAFRGEENNSWVAYRITEVSPEPNDDTKNLLSVVGLVGQIMWNHLIKISKAHAEETGATVNGAETRECRKINALKIETKNLMRFWKRPRLCCRRL